MGLSIRVVNGSGRAICTICNEKIEKGTLNQVDASGYQTSSRCHRSCITNWEKVQILKNLDDKNDIINALQILKKREAVK